jgi:hypothetical protein
VSNWFADKIGSAAGGLVYAFGGGRQEQARGDSLDAQLAQLNSAEYGQGGRIYNRIEDERGTAAADTAFDQVQTDLETGRTGDVLAQLQEEGRAGANQGLNDFWSGIGNMLKGVLGLFPWWLWLAAGAGLFIYLGGLGLLKGKLLKA